MPPEPLNYSTPAMLAPARRLRRWASAALVVCLLGLGPGLLLLKGLVMLARDQHVRRGSVIFVATEARWAGVGLILWAAAIPAYGWFQWRRHGDSRRAAALALSVFVLLLAAGATCQGVAYFKRQARQDQELRDRLHDLPPEVREQAQRIVD